MMALSEDTFIYYWDRFAMALRNDRDPVQALLTWMAVGVVSLLPPSIIRNSNCFTKGYGLSVAIMGSTLLVVFDGMVETPCSYLSIVLIVYGLRIAALHWFRDCTVDRMAEETREFDQDLSWLQVTPIVVALGVYYSLMVSPVLFAQRQRCCASSSSSPWWGLGVASLGLLVETIADGQKQLLKRRNNVRYGDERFVSPTIGLYSLCRHPNYTGEIMFWAGIMLGGGGVGNNSTIPSFLGVTCCKTLAWLSIVVILNGAAERLDTKHLEAYGDDPAFQRWKSRVPNSLFPCWPRDRITLSSQKQS